ncbi:MAG TPA: division/cell wall cluster transcriptional repressor MraZ [Candidatus Polarisedimenticolia bacterium]|nr:division/cell wall cluster transcriptional repressor MraZ [Candidatus Polarisedimenticolia bacterium]
MAQLRVGRTRMLDGSFTIKVDEKGRVKLPSEFRRQIQDRFGDGSFYVTSVKGDCALIYPARAWDDVLQKLSTQPPSRSPVRKFRRATSYYGQPANPDPQGRVLIHPRLRIAAGLEEDVVVVGQQNHLEVWNLKKFTDQLGADPINADDEDYLATLGI